MLTIGVEEEFLLLRPNGAVAPVGADVARLAGVDGRIVPEYMAYQLETITPVCTGLDDLHSELTRLRELAACGAERAGVRLVASGAPPMGGPVDTLTDNARYRKLARRYPDATAAGGACACHVHVGIADRDLAVQVLARLRPWLPTLLALTVNSPFIGGGDSGWSSTRYREQLRWPTFRPPEAWTRADRYDRAVRALISRGVAMDHASVYFLARLSARFPTIEVRVADTCLTVEDTVLLAGVVRALVISLIDDAQRGRRIGSASRAAVSERLLTAAQQGMSPRGFQFRDRTDAAAAALINRLIAKIAPALAATGDAEKIRNGLDRLVRIGTGADRQRDLWARTYAPQAFVASLANLTTPVTATG